MLSGNKSAGQSAPWAQSSYTAITWTTADGLPIDRINDVVQTPDGYVWAATIEGLVRFDGVRFHTFNASNTPAMETSRLILLHLDKRGTLWVVSEQLRVVRYADYRFEQLHLEGRPVELTGPAPHVTQRLYEDSDGAMWFATPEGAVRVDEADVSLVAPDSTQGAVLGIGRAAGRGVWISYAEGVAFRIRPDGTTERFGRAEGLTGGFVSRVFADGSDRTWASAEAGIFRLVDGVFRPTLADRRSAGTGFFFGLVETDGTPWFGTTGGVSYLVEGEQLRYAVHVDSLPFIRVPGPASLLRGYSNWRTSASGTTNFVYHNSTLVHTFVGTFHTLWAGNRGDAWIASSGGLIYLSPTGVTVVDAPVTDGETANIYPVLQDARGTIWAGHLFYEVLRIDHRGVELWNARNRGMDAGHPWSLYEDRRGRVLVAGIGICRLGPLPVVCPPEDLRPPAVGGIRAMWEDRSGRFWLGGESGLAMREGGNWRRLDSGTPGIPSSWVRAIDEMEDGTLWFGTNGGGLFRHRDGRFESFTESDGFCSNLVRDLYSSEDGALWVATEDRGLCRIANPGADDISDLSVGAVGTDQGLGFSGIHAVASDAFGRLWMSANGGIGYALMDELTRAALDPAEGVHFHTYDERDGMASREANGGVQPASLTARDGTIWFPTQSGLVVVDPARVATPEWGPVRIESVTLGDSTFHPLGTVRLGPDETMISVAYTYPEFGKPEALRFQYRLGEGDWVQAGSERIARLPGIPPGQSTFEVRVAEGLRGVDESASRIVLFREPRFGETAWFWILAFLAAAGLGAAGSYARNVQLRKRTRELERRVELRTKDLRSALSTVAMQTEELRSLDEAKSRFFANVSHELRTPLTMIVGPLRGMLEGRYGMVSGDAGTQLEIMLRNSRRLLRLVNQILDLAQLDSGHMALDARPHDLNRFVEQLVEAFQGAAESRDIALNLQTSGPIEVPFDPQHLEVILLNLISNAIKFTPQDGTISVRLEERSAKAFIKVSDTGIGIAQESLSRVFDRFYQEEGSPGTGIGLALARELARLHDGDITVESQLGKGSTFTVVLPGATTAKGAEAESISIREIDLPQRAASVEEEVRESGPEDRTSILVVEDNQDLRQYLVGLLESEYRVLQSADGQAAAEVVARELPDLILSDVMMPGMDGLELSRTLKTNPMTAHIPLILLTAKASRRDALEGLRMGADDYIAKPFDPEELLARLRNQLRTRQSLRARYEGIGRALRQEDADREDDSLEAQCVRFVRGRMSEPDLSVQDMADALNLTYSTLNRRLASEAGIKGTQLIRRVRLKEAAALLEEGAGSITEVAYGVGFNTLSYFARCFREEFGVLPSAYLGTQEAP